MTKEKRILIYFISFLLGFFLIMFIGISGVFAATYDTQAVTWYYRKTSDESTELNVVKDVNTPLNIVSGEYMNGFTTRQDHTFEKNLQYIVTYKLKMLYYDPLDGAFRQDTISRLTEYSWVDSDFKLLNTNVNQNKYLCEADICEREFTISQQVLTLNSTGGIRFGVYTTEPKSIGFYSPPYGSINITLSNTITIEDNSSSTIIDQNNQIIQGQDGINNNITNSTNTITGSITETEDNLNSSIQSSQDNINQNIDDMEDAIVDSNNQTQEVIKDQFNSCRDSYNLLNYGTQTFTNYYQQSGLNIKPGTYTISAKITSDDTDSTYSRVYFYDIDGNSLGSITLSRNSRQSGTITLSSTAVRVTLLASTNYTNSKDKTATWENIMLNEGTTSKPYEPYGEICSNKIDETNDKLDGIQGALTDTSTPNLEILGDTAGWLPPGPLDSVLNLPLTMLNNLLTNLGRTCSTFRVELPFVNKNIEIPCVESLMEQMGALVLWSWVGRIASVIILYSYLMNLYAWADKILTLRAEFDEAMGADLANWGRL